MHNRTSATHLSYTATNTITYSSYCITSPPSPILPSRDNKELSTTTKMATSSPPPECPAANNVGNNIVPPPECPASHDNINPLNNMPNNLAQEPWPGQLKPLDTHRVPSTIPKSSSTSPPSHQTGTETSDVWVYPSQQQFFNAMKRKGWANADERDMNVVVQIHNAVNEKSWQEVKKWEDMHACECERGPRLLKFSGKPTQLSPKARFLTLMGYTPPFDRHDWIVDRCGKQVRYVVDFYQGKKTLPGPVGPHSPAQDVAVMHIDARPALDSIEAAWDRIKMFWKSV